MEAIATEYITCVIEAVMTMFFCLYILRDKLSRLPFLALYTALLAVVGSGISMGMSVGLSILLPFPMDYGTVTLLPWFAVGFYCLRKVSREPGSGLMFILFLSVQVLHLCRSVTYFIYGVFFPALTDGPYRWADIPGFGIPSIILTSLLAVFCQRLYRTLRELNLKEFVRLWIIPLFFILLYLIQTNLYPEGNFTLANAFRIIINLCAFVTYSQMVSAIANASKAAHEADYHAQLSSQLELQQARVEDLESHAKELKRIRHDSRQHIQVLRGFLEKGEVRESLNYLNDYEGSMATAVQTPLCSNFVADTLCRRYETLAKQSDINVTISISLPEKPGIPGSNLAIILGNLWENAICAALDAKGEKRFIRLNIQTREDKLLIRMENGYSGAVCREGERFLSTKPGRNKSEGVGISSIRSVVQRYDGIAEFTCTGDVFVVSILMYMDM